MEAWPGNTRARDQRLFELHGPLPHLSASCLQCEHLGGGNLQRLEEVQLVPLLATGQVIQELLVVITLTPQCFLPGLQDLICLLSGLSHQAHHEISPLHACCGRATDLESSGGLPTEHELAHVTQEQQLVLDAVLLHLLPQPFTLGLSRAQNEDVADGGLDDGSESFPHLQHLFDVVELLIERVFPKFQSQELLEAGEHGQRPACGPDAQRVIETI
jgi:hypothetical protein